MSFFKLHNLNKCACDNPFKRTFGNIRCSVMDTLMIGSISKEIVNNTIYIIYTLQTLMIKTT